MDQCRKPLSLIVWNAESIRNKLIEYENFLTTNSIDIALISETNLQQNHNISLSNYTIIRRDRTVLANTTSTNVGGGVAICVKKNVPYKQVSSSNTKVIETVGIEVQGATGPITLMSIYFPGTRLSQEKLNHFKNDLRILTSMRSSYLLCGDLNAKHRFWNCIRSNQAGKILFDKMANENLLVHFPPTPTHFPRQANRTTPSTIDLVLSNGLASVTNMQTINDLSSDHLPVYFNLDHQINRVPSNSMRNYAAANWEMYKSMIDDNIDLRAASNEINSIESVNTAITNLFTIIKRAEERAVPLVSRKSEQIKLSPEILTLISTRNCIRRQWQRTRCGTFKAQANFLDRLIKSEVNKLKNAIWNRKLSEFRSNSRQFWRATKLLKNSLNKIPPLRNANNRLLMSDAEKAAEIADSFHKSHSITYQDRSDSSTEAAVSTSIINLNFIHPRIDNASLPTPHEITTLVRHLKKRKSPGDDGINNILIKALPVKAIVYVTYIFRACFKISYFPEPWQYAKVIPIPKPGKDLTRAMNYRPISLLSTFSKLFEKLILSRLKTHVDRNNIIPNVQFGFRSGHSTNHQLLRVKKHITEHLTLGKSTGMITFDVEKAFDAVWHKALIHKMIILKFPLALTKLIQSFLSKRKFYVSINDSKSNDYNIVAGVPQGCVLSPTLYNIFTSDLDLSANSCEAALFADDTAIYYSAKNPTTIIRNLNSASTNLSNYCKRWKIKLNSSKTKAMFFTRRRCERLLPSESVFVQNTRINWAEDIKYLGLTLDKTLTFSKHVNNSIEKTLKFIAILYPLINRKSELNTANKLLLYKSVLRSILLYACPVWNNCADCHIKKLQIIQNKCLKIIFKLPYHFSTRELHKIANIPLVADQIAKNTDNFRRKLVYSDNPLIRQLL